MTLTRRNILTLGLGALALGAVLMAVASSSHSFSRVQALPEIEDYWQARWLGSDALLLTPDLFDERLKDGKLKLSPMHFDLATGKRTPLAFLPKDSIDPLPSPDGQWVLYKESRGGGTGNAVPYGVRWRLVHTDGSETRFLPSDGSFQSVPDEIGEPLPCAYWLPDSSGWISVTHRGSKYNQTLERFRLDAPNGAPEILTFPGGNIKSFNLEDISPDGRLVFTDYVEYTLQLCAPVSGSVPTAPFRIIPPFGGLSQFTSDGNAALALFNVHKTGLTAWFADLFHRPLDTVELRRIPFSGAPPTALATNLPVTTSFNLSPDRKHVLIRSDQFYVVALEEGK
ncbi:hypothetical protein [Armatimonas sp.]|uniref:TolB family protein n=1 Tax=Armatimonas sp. TaxID=1872638 RepID=UPI00286CEB48|nr:hypothetical protein [Armatimonas sp.]